MYLWILLDAFLILAAYAAGISAVLFIVQQRRGLPFSVSRIKRQKGTVDGRFSLLALLYLLFSFYLGVRRFSGNEQVQRYPYDCFGEEEYGLPPGSRIDKFDYGAIEAADGAGSSGNLPGFGCSPMGTTLTITVKKSGCR